MNLYAKIPLCILLFFFVKLNGHAATATLEGTQNFAIEALKDSINGWKDKVNKTNNFIDNLGLIKGWELPVALRKVVGTTEYQIIVERIYGKKNKRFFNASLVMYLPEQNEPLYFRAEGIPLGKKGVSPSAKLYLLSNESIEINNYTTLEILGENQGTFVEIECGGYKRLGIEGRYSFKSEFLVSENPDGTPDPSTPVTATFKTVVAEWGDMVATLSMSPFQVSGLDGFTFYPNQVSIDKSDISNPTDIVFPANYLSTYFDGFSAENWTGIHIAQATVKLPQKLSPKGGERKEIAAYDFLIDNQGVTGTIGVENILSNGEGRIGKWPFSIETLFISLQANRLESAHFSGEVGVPFFANDKTLSYEALISLDDTYLFSVSDIGKVKTKLWAAEMVIDENSSIEIGTYQGEFRASLNLHGSMNIASDFSGNEGKAVQISGIRFENLKIQSYKPYIQPGQFATSGSANCGLSNFPLSIQNINVISRGGKTGLNFDAVVQLMGESDKGFGGETNISLFGEALESDDVLEWKPSGVEVNKVEIDVDGGAFQFYGSVEIFKEDPVYGKGFKGSVRASFMPGISASATAQFGNVDGYAYWYVDASLSLPTGTPIGPGLAIYGFKGGARYHMRSANLPTSNSSANTDNMAGQTRSGNAYVPDKEIGLALKAGVILGTHPTPIAFNGDATFEIEFYTSGGISKVQFIGDAYFMCKLSDRPSKPPIRAVLSMTYIPRGRVFHASIDTYFNMVVIEGTGKGGHAGQAVFHTEKDAGWYLYLGTPSSPIGLKLLKVLKAQSYLMMGTSIEPFPDPPKEVGDILGEANLSLVPNANTLSNAGGFAFGASLRFDTGDITFLIFYGRVKAGLGFDVMLANYGENASCKGRSGPIGMNGWYAMGQAWAYVDAKVGIKVKVFGKRKKFNILEVGAAAILQASLPNPSYFRGIVGGRYSILGGFIKGRVKFKFSFGKQCKIVGANNAQLASLNIIQDVKPAERTTDVDVFSLPQATLSIPANKSFSMRNADGKNISYRVNLDYAKVFQDDHEVAGTYELTNDNSLVSFIPTNVFNSKSEHRFEVRVSFQEYKDGRWVKVKDGNNDNQTESKNTTFTTGEEPNYIREDNVLYSYPVKNQLHFHPKESKTGYLGLRQGRPNLFDTTDGLWEISIQFKNHQSDQVHKQAISYDEGKRMVLFNIPEDLALDALYNIEIVKTPKQTETVLDANITVSEKEVLNTDDNTMSIEEKSIEGSTQDYKETSLIDWYSHTSHYETFVAKLDDYQSNEKGWWWPIASGVSKIGMNLKGKEHFDAFEINGSTNFPPLVSFTVDQNDDWVQNHLIPSVYQPYPIEGITIKHRDTEVYGVVPLKAFTLYQTPEFEQLNPADPTSGPFESKADFSSIEYLLPEVAFYDKQDLKEQVAMRLYSQEVMSTTLMEYLTKDFTFKPKGEYNMILQYRLPGINKVSSSYNFKIRVHQ